MSLEETLSGIDTLVFPDVNDLELMNRWSRSKGFVNYAAYISKIVLGDAMNAKSWLREEVAKVTPEKTTAELLEIINPKVIVQEVIPEVITGEVLPG